MRDLVIDLVKGQKGKFISPSIFLFIIILNRPDPKYNSLIERTSSGVHNMQGNEIRQ